MSERRFLCTNCFKQLNTENSKCPICGWDNSREQIKEGLAYGTVLNNRYEIGRAKSMNGEGITYSALDISSQRLVELREFFPVTIAYREDDGTVFPLQGKAPDFSEYLNSFLDLQRNISRLKEVTVISSVLDIFQDNCTAYAVYEYKPSVTLKRYVENGGVIPWNTAKNQFMPVITALGLMHSLGIKHLGLSNETIKVTSDGNILITSFSIPEVRMAGTPLIEDLYDGFAAVEQYVPDGICGEMTDVYSFTAVFVYAISGVVLNTATARLKDEKLLIPTEYLRPLPPYAIEGIANALQVKQESRTKSFEKLRTDFQSAATVRSEISQTHAIKRLPPIKQSNVQGRGLPPFVWLMITFAITLIALFVVASMWLKDSGKSFEDVFDFFDKESSISDVSLVPDMLNQSYEEWEKKVADGEYSFKLKVLAREFNDTVEEGYIISQNPNKGKELAEDTVIGVVVSRGSATRTLPEIKGLSFVELSELLEKNGFIVQKEEEASDDIALGNVIRYKDYSEGDMADYNSTIILVVSTGPLEE